MSAMDFFTNINLHGNELQVASLEKLSAAPTTNVVVGRVYYNTADGFIYVCTNASTPVWAKLAVGGDVSSLTTRVSTLESNVGIDSAGAATGSGLKKDVSDIQTAIGSTSYTGGSITAAIAAAQGSIGTLETTVGGASSGLVKDVDDLQTAVGASTDSASASGSLYARIAQLDSVKAPLASPALTGTPTAPTADAGTNTTQIATTAFVKAAVDASYSTQQAMRYKGTVGTGGTVTELPTTGVAIGDTYVAKVAGTYGGIVCEAGDMIIAQSTTPTWTVVQANIDGAVVGPASSTENHIAIFTGTGGKAIGDSGYTIATSVPADAVFTDTTYAATSGQTTITGANNAIGLATTAVTAASYGPSADASPSYGGTFSVPYVTVDAYGRLTAASTKTITLPASDNTDVAVAQTADDGSTELAIALATVSSSGAAAGIKYATGVTVTPSTGTVTATTFSGSLTGNVTGNVSGSSGSCTGNAATATALANSQNFSITGGATASAVGFNGSSAVALNVTALDADKISAGTVGANYLPFVVNRATINTTAGTAVTQAHGCTGGVCTVSLFKSTGEQVFADIKIDGTNISVTTSEALTGAILGWTGFKS